MGLNPVNIFSDIWDHNITGMLRILYDDKEYCFYRNKDDRYLFHNETLIFSSNKNSEWNGLLGVFFNYPLKLRLKSNHIENYAGLEGLLVPYFIEQDTGWSLNWSGPFIGLARYKDFYKEILSNFTGFNSIESIAIKQDIDLFKSDLTKLKTQLKLYEDSFHKIKIETSHALPRTDKNQFRREIKKSSNELKSLLIKQKNLKNSLSELIQKKFKLKSILRSSIRSYKEIALDIDYLDENLEVECPTCGTLHKKTLEASASLEFDYTILDNNIKNLKNEILEIDKKIAPLNSSLVAIDKEIDNFNKTLQSSKNNIIFQDIIDVEANKKISKSFERNIKSVAVDIKKIEEKISLAEKSIESLESKDVKKEIKKIFENKLKYNFNQLNIPFNGKINQIQSRPNIGGGSSNPRAILALHMTYLELSLIKTNLPLFPFVIDTPQQNGQDMNNLSNTFNHLENIDFTQLIIGSEIIPSQANLKNYKVLEFKNKNAVLNLKDYTKVSKLFNNFDTIMNNLLEV